LRKVITFGDRLKAKCGEHLDETGRDYLERMQNATRRMQQLITDLSAEFSNVNDSMEAILRFSEAIAGSDADSTDKMRKRILLDKIRSFEVRRIVTISDAEISQYFKNHQQLFMISPIYRLRQILFLANSEEERIHKQSQARSVSRRLQAGESFRELALQHSAGPEAAEGGELGLVHHDELLIPLAEALLTMKPGEISAPIETILGFHIIALDETIPQAPKPLEDVEEQIKAKLFEKRSEQVFQNWLADLKKKAFIEIRYSPLSTS